MYQYLYDAVGRRRLKVYPTGKSDEYFYDGDKMIEDVGVVSQGASTDLMLTEYFWLGGMPLAMLRTRLAEDSTRTASTDCTRNDEASACGTFFIVNDYLPKPIALIDSNGKLANVAEYDVFGRVNEVQLRADAPAPVMPAGSANPLGPYYSNFTNYVMATGKQPWSGNQRIQARVNYAQVNTPGNQYDASNTHARTWVATSAGQVAPTPCPSWLWCLYDYPNWYGGPMYAVTTNWFDVPSDGAINVLWTSDATTPDTQYTGATVRSYEYRRYENGASPTWMPLRFPGQYADAETGLFENWNRFYDPAVGRYLASDPILHSASTEAPEVYGYALNSPINASDSTGLEPDGLLANHEARRLCEAVDCTQEEFEEEATEIAEESLELLVQTALVFGPSLPGRVAIALVLLDADPAGAGSDKAPSSAPGATLPTLPAKVIVDEKGIKVVHNYGAGASVPGAPVEHSPAHAHVMKGGKELTRIGPKGHVLKGDPELNGVAKEVVKGNAKRIRNVLNKVGRYRKMRGL